MNLVLDLLSVPTAPNLLLSYTERARGLMKQKHIEQLVNAEPTRKMSPQNLYYGRFLRHNTRAGRGTD
jgi:hypothetical protein